MESVNGGVQPRPESLQGSGDPRRRPPPSSSVTSGAALLAPLLIQEEVRPGALIPRALFEPVGSLRRPTPSSTVTSGALLQTGVVPRAMFVAPVTISPRGSRTLKLSLARTSLGVPADREEVVEVDVMHDGTLLFEDYRYIVMLLIFSFP
jgi:hypothetical protein